mmetsp:Transcript_27170/g.68462  ORF Transcript_27170/g.68462 Transcript_27170/m.68462 type:complete len:122 (-) Transcript_27170:88-453(-)|eukprot:CAMPEP_0173423214 /NCGR_PEP_ID=MMETSP1357-20121228/3609_1 /TAXON_ID=77926 /ORGANISM="Hemiselmis rufescens, Strain PCC563" /LENGTH=121 /DNA_ID=CAMNT_0014386307 /DNA_START=73 /DNA_END=438 /DNA_ORIENTATION=-
MVKVAGLAGSVILSLLLSCMCFGALQYYSDSFASSAQMQVAGGVVAGLLYFFLLVLLSSVVDVFSKSRSSVGWMSVILTVAAAEWAASSVHSNCCLPCGFTCALLTWYLHYCSDKLNSFRI